MLNCSSASNRPHSVTSIPSSSSRMRSIARVSGSSSTTSTCVAAVGTWTPFEGIVRVRAHSFFPGIRVALRPSSRGEGSDESWGPPPDADRGVIIARNRSTSISNAATQSESDAWERADCSPQNAHSGTGSPSRRPVRDTLRRSAVRRSLCTPALAPPSTDLVLL